MAAPKKKPQTEDKAKGLIGWENGKPKKDAPYKVGDYKGRTLNLTKKQVAKAGGSAVKASRNTVSISDTKYEKGKGVTGKDGKLLNGRVDMGGGNFAVYVNGKRVGAAAKKAAATRSGGSKTGSASGTKWEANRKAGRDALKAYGPAKKKATGPTMSSKKKYGTTDTSTLRGIAAASKKKAAPKTKSMKAPINWGKTVSW